MSTPLLILYGSQTGNAQDVAESIGREARLRFFAPRVLSMDAYDVSGLPREQLLVCVASTTGQGEAPDNMRRFWRFLLRKSLPPDSLAATRYAVFGLGDSGYPQFNVVAKKLDRRLEGLGAVPLVERGLGDDQHPNGYEAALDPWLVRLWAALRAAQPLPVGLTEPVLTEDDLLALGPAKYRVVPLGPEEAAQARAALAARLAAEQPHVLHPRDAHHLVVPATPHAGDGEGEGDEGPASTSSSGGQVQGQEVGSGTGSEGAGGGGGLAAHWQLAAAMAAAADFRRLALYVAGGEDATAPAAVQQGRPSYGPWRPYLSRLVCNARLTAADHFQDTRHVELELAVEGEGAQQQGPGLQGQEEQGGQSRGGLDVEHQGDGLGSGGLQGEGVAGAGAAGAAGAGRMPGCGMMYEPGDLLAIMPRTSPAAVDAFLRRCGLQGEQWVRLEAAEARGGDGAAEGPVVVASIRALVQGCLDVDGASPRRYFFQVLRHYATAELERERLSYFATAEGRDDLYRYNQREGRTALEVLSDFRSATPPLERLLEAAPPLRPRLFSIASAPALRGRTAHLLVALVRYNTPYKRVKRGLCSSYLEGLRPQDDVRVAVWTERGTMRMPKSPATPLILVGPGTGVAPFRSFLEDRYARLAPPCTRLLPPSQPPNHHANAATASGPTANGNGHAAADACAVVDAPGSNSAGRAGGQQETPEGQAPCYLFFGCRSRTADYYHQEQWEEYARAGVLHPEHGLVTAFSRDPHGGSGGAADGSSGGTGGSGGGVGDAAGVQGVSAAGAEAAANGDSSEAAVTVTGGKVYVTHRIREMGAVLWPLLREQGAVVYVSGSASKMPAGVAAAFADVAAAHGGMGREEAAAWVRQLELKGRYFVEAWS